MERRDVSVGFDERNDGVVNAVEDVHPSFVIATRSKYIRMSLVERPDINETSHECDVISKVEVMCIKDVDQLLLKNEDLTKGNTKYKTSCVSWDDSRFCRSALQGKRR